jgi:hypothetical protein
MDTFQLINGTITFEDDNLSIQGDDFKKRWKLNLISALCWTTFFSLQGIKNIINFQKTHDNSDLLLFFFDISMFVLWLVVGGYFRVFRLSKLDQISIKEIVKVNKKNSLLKETTVVQLYLTNNKVRQLEFEFTDDLRFAELLSSKGINVMY